MTKGQWSLPRIKKVFAARGIPIDRTHTRAAELGSRLTVKILSELGKPVDDGYEVIIKREWVPDREEFEV